MPLIIFCQETKPEAFYILSSSSHSPGESLPYVCMEVCYLQTYNIISLLYLVFFKNVQPRVC